jgi:hypothetical protein
MSDPYAQTSQVNIQPTVDDIQSKFVKALRSQDSSKKPTETSLPSIFPCPDIDNAKCHDYTFQNRQQLLDHYKFEHKQKFNEYQKVMTAEEFENMILEQSRKVALSNSQSVPSEKATAGGGSAPDITTLSLEPEEKSRQSPPYSGKKRPAESEGHGRRGKAQPSHVEMANVDSTRNIRKPDTAKLFNPNQPPTSSPQRPVTEPRDATKNDQSQQTQLQSPSRPLSHRSTPKAQYPQHQPGLLELQRYDPRYPGLLLHPDSRPISQEQLASEVKSIHAGLTMVEAKCIHVDRVQAAAAQDSSDPNHKLASNHWQASIALHRTLLHEHHDFFLASQHPSASPALRRLASKYSMPARMWKHGIHSFLELLRRHLPDSIDYMLAFIYLAYQMMALLYETVPAFEDTWIECLGDLGRYRMAIEDENIRDRETWADVARSWCMC